MNLKQIIAPLAIFSTLSLTGFSQNTFPSNGYAGIGTTAPNGHLEIKEPSNRAVQIIVQNSISSNGGFLMELLDNNISFNLRERGHLSFFVNGREGMRLSKDGFVGVGTNNPIHPLSVQGKIQSLSGGFVFPDGTVQTTAANQSNLFSSLYATDFIKVGNNSIYIDEINLGGGLTPENHIYASNTSGDLYINCADPSFVNPGSPTANTIFHFDGNKGGVGIATDVLEQYVKLHVADGFALFDGSQASILFDKHSSSVYGQYGIEYLSTNETGSLGGLNFWKPFGSNAGLKNYQMFISDAGQVGIGVNPSEFVPGYKLFVDDGILCEQVKVALRSTADWADFVFDIDYKLKPLKEVKAFIDENKHLPDVPSASDVVKNGINMAEMDATLLQKIEELTLYTIKQQELIEQMQKELELLKSKQ
ncbi:hypothetical protein [Aureispira anguillae]|uniref:Peptidase S74 domain-containing protein n=1 Tax=Aureispira anguillae TaxID=2864201 RepID=A0A916DU83_9BACT|nr:hypothetical protein [Aureispira anguillae]BDS13116.1 hypothetical protein AsAng_0038440 [Aureispira anguillae]